MSTLPGNIKVILGLNDGPANDFNTLAATLERNRAQLSREGELNVLKLMLPASFYEPVLPAPLKADISFSLSALHYLEHELQPLDSLPADAIQWEANTREAAKAFSVTEMVKFFRLRAQETRSPGGIFIVALPSQREADDRVWWGLGLSMRAALISAVADGRLDKSVVLRHGVTMGTRTVEQVYKALETVEDVWSTDEVFLKDIEHPDYTRYLEETAGVGADQKREAYLKFAKTLVEMAYAVYHPFLLSAIRGKTGNGGNSVSESKEETVIIEELKRKSLEYYCEHEMGSRFWMPHMYIRLRRR